MSILGTIFSKGASNLVDSVGKVLDEVISTKEERQNLDNELRRSEMQFQVEMQKLAIEERKMYVEDTGNARSREIEIAQSEHATKLSKNVTPYLALGTVFLAFILFFVLIFRPDTISQDAKEIVLYVLGILSAILVQVYSYYFGSSSGSAAKDATINKLK